MSSREKEAGSPPAAATALAEPGPSIRAFVLDGGGELARQPSSAAVAVALSGSVRQTRPSSERRQEDLASLKRQSFASSKFCD